MSKFDLSFKTFMILIIIIFVLIFIIAFIRNTNTHITIMSFNIYGGGRQLNVSLYQTAKVIIAANADIIGIQETRQEDPEDDNQPIGVSVAKDLANMIGYYYYDQTYNNTALWSNAILSKHPIVHGTSSPNDLGVMIRIYDRLVYVWNVHLEDEPYQPYQIMGWDVPVITSPEQAIYYANYARRSGINLLLNDMRTIRRRYNFACEFVFGDFNEPSHLDWTNDTVIAGRQPMIVEFPTTKRLEQVGFIDAYRNYYPDPVNKQGYTWTSNPNKIREKYDRIDYTFYRSNSDVDITVVNAGTVGEISDNNVDIVVDPYPSDHRATYATIAMSY